MKSLLDIVNKLISLEELNPLAVSYDLNHSWKDKIIEVELKNTDKKGSKIIIKVSVEKE